MKKHQTNIMLKLMDKYNLSSAEMCEKLDISPTILKNLVGDKTEPDLGIRNKIRMIFEGEDAFPNIDDSCEYCKKCKHTCKQFYFARVVYCPKVKK